MIYLLRKHDVISVPPCAAAIYHRAKVRYHIEDIPPVPTGTDIIEKALFCLPDKRGLFHGGHMPVKSELRAALISCKVSV